MRGQVVIISAVLIAGIIIGLTGVSYMWGAPLIEKRSIVTQVNSAEAFIKDVNDAIISIASSGAGNRDITIPFGVMELRPIGMEGSMNNSLVFSFVVQQAIIGNYTIVPLEPEIPLDEVLGLGEAPPHILSMAIDRVSDGYRLDTILHYRTLVTETGGFQISLEGEPSIGTKKLIARWGGTETVETEDGIRIVRSKIGVQLV